MKLGVHGSSLNLQDFGVFETIDYAAQAGLDTEQVLRTGIAAAQALGSPVVQVFMGNLHNRLASVPFEQRLDGVASVIEAVKPLIEETGIRPAIENHGDTTARELA